MRCTILCGSNGALRWRRSLSASACLVLLLSVPDAGEGQQAPSGGTDKTTAGWTGNLTGGVSLLAGESDALWLSLGEQLQRRWSALELDVDGRIEVHLTRKARREGAEGGAVVAQRRTSTLEIYDVAPTLRWLVHPSWFGVLDYDWGRDPTQGVEHLSFASGGGGVRASGGGAPAEPAWSRSLEVRAGYLYERDSDGDESHAPMAATRADLTRTLASTATLDAGAELLMNLAEFEDYRATLSASLTAPVSDRLGLELRFRSVWRNRALELLVDPTNRERAYDVERVRSSLSASFSFRL
jgi:hypothetical protein